MWSSNVPRESYYVTTWLHQIDPTTYRVVTQHNIAGAVSFLSPDDAAAKLQVPETTATRAPGRKNTCNSTCKQ